MNKGFVDRFVDNTTYSKRSSDVKKQGNIAAYKKFASVFEQYAKAVNVSKVSLDFENIVREYWEYFAISYGSKLKATDRSRWIDYYNRHE